MDSQRIFSLKSRIMKKRIHIIFNPVAGAGKAGKLKNQLIALLKKRLDEPFGLDETTEQGDAIRLARQAVESGARLLIAVGGDGTINEVVNGLLTSDLSSGSTCELGILNCGSGAGFAQTLKLPASLSDQLDLICQTTARPVDIGLITFTGEQGSLQQRYFVNECQVGISAAIVSRVGMQQKRFGGTLAFASATLSEAFHFKAVTMLISQDGHFQETQNLLGIVVGNGHYCAGGMQLTPKANPADGQLDLLCIGEMSLPVRLLNFGKVYSGKHVFSKHFSVNRIKAVEISATPPVRVEADGELLGQTPCEIKILPGALKVKF